MEAAGLIKDKSLLNFSNTMLRTSDDANNLGTGFYAVYVGENNASGFHYPEGYGALFSVKGFNGVGFQIMFSVSGVVYARSIWEAWTSWRQL